jgi:ribosomal protein S18 acetylase RimI-like enzyme
MQIRKANRSDVNDIAKLALIAGEGIPAWFWKQSAAEAQNVEDAGAAKLLSETDNFSYRNVHVAVIDGKVAGMILAYRLPDVDDAEDLDELPEFIRPLVELEQCVPGSLYINMIATFPQYRNMSIGTKLMGIVDRLANDAACSISSLEVFEQNTGALRLYQRLGYEVAEKRRVVPHECHPYDGELLLLTRTVGNG